MTDTTIPLALIGARGHTGKELLTLLAAHPHVEVVAASSRALAETPISAHVEAWEDEAQTFSEITEEDLVAIVRDRDARAMILVLALPNTVGRGFTAALDTLDDDVLDGVKILDLSSDGRFDDTWQYGWPERMRTQIAAHHRIANPGCYATGMQTALWPLIDLLGAPPTVFGVSGYSGAGTTPSPKNDPEVLRDNLLPYALTEHTHEREVSRQLDHPLFFTPHVAPFFRGITLTISMQFAATHTAEELYALYDARYAKEPLVHLLHDRAPLVRDNMHRHHVAVGGLSISEDGRHGVVVATLDNLLKGAATQAMQNINLLAGFDEYTAIPLSDDS